MRAAGPTNDRPTNRILQALPAAERRRLSAAVVGVSLDVKTVLFEPGQPIDVVHFPVSAVVSLVTPFAHGVVAEVATVGNEGIVGVPLVAGGSLAVRAIALVPGRALLMDASRFLDEMDRSGPFRRLVQTYLQALFGQISRAVACNRLHSDEERLARWLLMSQDRVGADHFAIGHAFLGQMLGSHRATVTLSVAILRAAGLIEYQHGQVTILDRTGLEEVSCECYASIRDELDRVVGRTRGN